MTNLKLVGTNHEQNYYTPNDLVYHDNSKTKLKSFDYYKNFLKIYKEYKNKTNYNLIEDVNERKR